jgi:hypothetical protein
MRRDFVDQSHAEAEVKLEKVGEAEHCFDRQKIKQKCLQINQGR